MIKQFQNLTKDEVDVLMKAPVLMSVLAACSTDGVNHAQKADAIRLSHLKTYTANSLLLPFYGEVEKNFEEQFESAVKEYTPFDKEKLLRLKAQIEKVKQIAKKLDPEYGNILLRSFEKYERHVRRAGHSVVEDFIFPIPIHGLSN